MFKHLWRCYGPNPFDSLLKKAKAQGKKRFLICWNRGLGDIPLGLFALIYRIRFYIPESKITFFTRDDLVDGFKMLPSICAIAISQWKRGQPFDLQEALDKANLNKEDFDIILERPNPSRWLSWQLGRVTPRLSWKGEWDTLADRFSLSKEKTYIGVHIQTETHYLYEKNWPLDYWRALFHKIIAEREEEIILFGFQSDGSFINDKIHDLRGKTTLFEMLSILKNFCHFLVAPDSGVLSMVYYMDISFPLNIVSLWADPKQGVLKQNVASPNPQLCHRSLIAQKKDLRSISVNDVIQTLFLC